LWLINQTILGSALTKTFASGHLELVIAAVVCGGVKVDENRRFEIPKQLNSGTA